MFFSKIHKRINLVLFIVILLFILVVFKISYIQIIEYGKLSKLASSLWNRNLPIEANRGNIYDRNGVELANNLTKSSLVLIPNQIKNKQETAKKLSDIWKSE